MSQRARLFFFSQISILHWLAKEKCPIFILLGIKKKERIFIHPSRSVSTLLWRSISGENLGIKLYELWSCSPLIFHARFRMEHFLLEHSQTIWEHGGLIFEHVWDIWVHYKWRYLREMSPFSIKSRLSQRDKTRWRNWISWREKKRRRNCTFHMSFPLGPNWKVRSCHEQRRIFFVLSEFLMSIGPFHGMYCWRDNS